MTTLKKMIETAQIVTCQEDKPGIERVQALADISFLAL